MIDLYKIMTFLAKDRMVFHSEADFQHSLAWLLHKTYDDYKVRLEYPYHISDEFVFKVDIMLIKGSEKIPIELKYKTKNYKDKLIIKYEEYVLKNHGAPDTARYDFCLDISRIEAIVNDCGEAPYGFAIFLTNDSAFLKESKGQTCDKDFRLHKRRMLKGTLSWAERTSPGTKKGREKDINIIGEYDLNWRDYNKDPNLYFQYLLIPVTR